MRSWKYDIIHELCHAILGHSCCREHAEFEAHGAAKVLCKILQIEIGDADERMDCYAGRSSHTACGRIGHKKKKHSGIKDWDEAEDLFEYEKEARE